MERQDKQNLVFENVWKKDMPGVKALAMQAWRESGVLESERADERANQLVFVVRNEEGQVVGMSTAFKAYIKQLRNYFYAFRCMLIPGYRIPGLTSKLAVVTRDFLESVPQEGEEPAIGLITLVENERLKQNRREAIWPATHMVYIGNSKEGHHIRVYYFKGARIKP